MLRPSHFGGERYAGSEGVKAKIIDQHTHKLDYSKAYYADIVWILKENWSEFESYFDENGAAVGRSAILKLLFDVNTAQRVNLAHPHKAHQRRIEFGPQDILILKNALSIVRAAVSNFSEAKKSKLNQFMVFAGLIYLLSPFFFVRLTKVRQKSLKRLSEGSVLDL